MIRVYWEGNADGQVELTLSKEESRHLVSVRRARQGDGVEVLNGRGAKAFGKVADANPKAVQVNELSWEQIDLPKPALVLFTAMTKASTFEFIIQKATELGAVEIVPLVTDHVEGARDDDRIQRKQERWNQILIEAVKQSGNPYKPILHLPEPMEGNGRLDSIDAGVVLALSDNPIQLADLQSRLKGEAVSRLGVFLGPEGDFSKREYEWLKTQQFHFMSLGPHVLRMETAAVAGLAVLQQLAL